MSQANEIRLFGEAYMNAEQRERAIAKFEAFRAFYASLDGCSHCGRPKPSKTEAYRMFTDAQRVSPAASSSSVTA